MKPNELAEASLQDAKHTSIKRKISKTFSAALTFTILCFFVFIGLRGCVVTSWAPPEQEHTYAIKGVDGREMSFTFLPDRRALIIYGDPNEKSFEAVLWDIRFAEYGRHYIGPLWNVSRSGESLFGIRWFSGGTKPIIFTYRIANKLHVGFGDSSFPSIGVEAKTTLQFHTNAVRFDGMWLREVPTQPDVINPLLKQFEIK